MKKLLVILIILTLLFLIGLILLYVSNKFVNNSSDTKVSEKKALLKVGLVADSHNDNDLLAKALSQAKGMGVNFVIGLGDYSNVGTIDELKAAKEVFEKSGLSYYVTLGDRDQWASRNAVGEATGNFVFVFGGVDKTTEQSGVRFLIVNNADIYNGISADDWEILNRSLSGCRGPVASSPHPCFIFAHKTPYHPQSAHIMGEHSEQVKSQANRLIELIEEKQIDGFFSGDLHFFAKFNSPSGSVKMTTIGAVTRAPNPQGPRFGVLTVYEDYSWEVEDIEIR